MSVQYVSAETNISPTTAMLWGMIQTPRWFTKAFPGLLLCSFSFTYVLLCLESDKTAKQSAGYLLSLERRLKCF